MCAAVRRNNARPMEQFQIFSVVPGIALANFYTRFINFKLQNLSDSQLLLVRRPAVRRATWHHVLNNRSQGPMFFHGIRHRDRSPKEHGTTVVHRMMKL